MQLNTSTDYAIRIVLLLAKHNKTVSSSKLSKELGVSSRYLLQIAAKLRDAGIVTASYGPSGGFGLAQPAADISLYDIIIVMEERIQSKQTSRCEVGIGAELFQMVTTAYEHVDSVIRAILKSMTIESLVSHSADQWHLAHSLIGQEKTKEESSFSM